MKKFVKMPAVVSISQGLFLKRLTNWLKEYFSALTGLSRSFVKSPQSRVSRAATAPSMAPSTAYWWASLPPIIFCRYGKESRVTKPIA